MLAVGVEGDEDAAPGAPRVLDPRLQGRALAEVDRVPDDARPRAPATSAEPSRLPSSTHTTSGNSARRSETTVATTWASLYIGTTTTTSSRSGTTVRR